MRQKNDTTLKWQDNPGIIQFHQCTYLRTIMLCHHAQTYISVFNRQNQTEKSDAKFQHWSSTYKVSKENPLHYAVIQNTLFIIEVFQEQQTDRKKTQTLRCPSHALGNFGAHKS